MNIDQSRRIILIRGIVPAAIMACLLLCVSCILLRKAATITDLMPRETDVPGWVVTRQVKLSGKKIAAVVASSARYDPREYTAFTYNHLSDKKKTVTVEVIKFASTLDAFGSFSAERGFDDATKFVTDDDYSSRRGCYFRIGKYYVRVGGDIPGEQTGETLDQFRTVLQNNMKKLNEPDAFPDQMFVFSADRSTRNIIYHKYGAESIPGSGSGFVMGRSLFEKKYLVWYEKEPTPYDADREFQRILKQGADDVLLSKLANLPLAVRIISEREYLMICAYKHWIFGVLNAETMDRGNNILVVLFNEIKTRGYKK